MKSLDAKSSAGMKAPIFERDRSKEALVERILGHSHGLFSGIPYLNSIPAAESHGLRSDDRGRDREDSPEARMQRAGRQSGRVSAREGSRQFLMRSPKSAGADPALAQGRRRGQDAGPEAAAD
eukprot:768293-Hanusia_phi.AAC.3